MTKRSNYLNVNSNGNYPLLSACCHGLINIIGAIFYLDKEDGVDRSYYMRGNKNGCTPFMMVCMANIPEVAEFIIESGYANVNAVNDIGSTALMFACCNGMDEIAERILKNVDGEGNGCPENVNSFSQTAFHWAVKNRMKTVN